MRNEPWREDAACLGLDTELFFPNPGETELFDTALRICTHCPVKVECLAYAEQVGAVHGIWGGASAYKRTRARNREIRERRPPLNEAGRKRVIELTEAGWNDSQIAREMDISPRTVFRVRARHTQENGAAA